MELGGLKLVNMEDSLMSWLSFPCLVQFDFFSSYLAVDHGGLGSHWFLSHAITLTRPIFTFIFTMALLSPFSFSTCTVCPRHVNNFLLSQFPVVLLFCFHTR